MPMPIMQLHWSLKFEIPMERLLHIVFQRLQWDSSGLQSPNKTVLCSQVIPDNASLSNFIQLSQRASTQGRSSDQIEKILYAGDQNLACQLLISLSQTLNLMASSAQQNAIAGKHLSFSRLPIPCQFLLENLPAQNLGVSDLTSPLWTSS